MTLSKLIQIADIHRNKIAKQCLSKKYANKNCHSSSTLLRYTYSKSTENLCRYIVYISHFMHMWFDKMCKLENIYKKINWKLYKSNIVHMNMGPSWSWSYGSWIYCYLINQCLSPLTLWVRTPFMQMCTRYNIMWQSLSVTCNRSVVFSGYSGFYSTNKTWRPRYNSNIVDSGVKHQ